MDFYFQDELRWSLGFDNPNKAAALIAAVLPLIWILVHVAWSLRGRMVRGGAISLASIVLCTGWWILFKTYSRGGILAATAAFVYIGWNSRVWRSQQRRVAMLMGTAVGIALFAGTDASGRSMQWMNEREGAVVNRLELWRGGIQMIASAPEGVGVGNSGSVYMQWFQPLESTTRYRTLVNSYLTFAAERGVLSFGVALFSAILFWRWTDVAATFEELGRGIVIGCRASILAFVVAGFFTTTMEDWQVWNPPGIAMLALGWITHRGGTASSKGIEYCLLKRMVVAGVLSMGICAAVFWAGLAMLKHAPLRVVLFERKIELMPNADRGQHRYFAILDEQVTGEDYGKLLRRLALNLNSSVRVDCTGQCSQDMARDGETLIAMGEAVLCLHQPYSGDLVLIAPSRLEPQATNNLLREAKSVLLLIPSFDEDGRGSCWREATARSGGARFLQKELFGVGTEVSWAWEQVLELMNEQNIKSE